MKKVISLITSNEGKVRSFNKILKNKNYDLDIKILNWDYPENKEEWTTSRVVLDWAKYCSDKYNMDVVVQDTGLFINSLKWFPWVNTKFALQTIGNVWLLKLLEWEEDRTAEWIFSLGYCERWWFPKEYTATLKWSIANESIWNLGFWFDPIFIPDWYTDTFWENPDLRDDLSPFHITVDALIKDILKK